MFPPKNSCTKNNTFKRNVAIALSMLERIRKNKRYNRFLYVYPISGNMPERDTKISTADVNRPSSIQLIAVRCARQRTVFHTIKIKIPVFKCLSVS